MEKTELKLSVPASEYRYALDAQSACNLSGIVHSFSRVVSLIWGEARENDLGTDYVNTHPICRLYAEQIAFLSGISGTQRDTEGYCRAYQTCEELAGI